MWTPVCVLASPIAVQPPAYGLTKQQSWLKQLDQHIYTRDLGKISGFWLQINSAPAIAAIGGVELADGKTFTNRHYKVCWSLQIREAKTPFGISVFKDKEDRVA